MAGYLGSTPVPQATQHRESFTATSGQTTFATAGYTAGFVDVYLNGSHLSPADFTATNGSDVVLASGASADDVCDIISHSAFELNAQTFTGDFTVDGTTLAVDSTNNRVGIGTSVPGVKLEVNGDGLQVRLDGTANTTRGILLRNTGSAEGQIQTDGNMHFIQEDAGKYMRFSTANTERMRIDATGAVTMPLQPAFQATPASTQANFPINALTTVVFGTERFDQNADFNNTNAANKFTAPVVGKYLLTTNLRVENVDKAYGNIQVKIVTSNKSYYSIINPAIYAQDAVHESLSLTILADMDASDTALVALYISNNGTAQADVHTDSYFSGYLVA